MCASKGSPETLAWATMAYSFSGAKVFIKCYYKGSICPSCLPLAYWAIFNLHLALGSPSMNLLNSDIYRELIWGPVLLYANTHAIWHPPLLSYLCPKHIFTYSFSFTRFHTVLSNKKRNLKNKNCMKFQSLSCSDSKKYSKWMHLGLAGCIS